MYVPGGNVYQMLEGPSKRTSTKGKVVKTVLALGQLAGLSAQMGDPFGQLYYWLKQVKG